MTKTSLKLTNNQFSKILSSLIENQKAVKTIHPADNMLFLTLENGVSIKITGHWEYNIKKEKIISSILENESVKDNFNKIEDLAEKLTLEQPTIKKTIMTAESQIKIEFTDKNYLIISVYITQEREKELLSIDYSSLDDTTHIHYDYENGNWEQSILLKKRF